MNAFLYGAALQWKLDIRSKSLLITCYVVPLAFLAVMGEIFTSLMPETRDTLIQSMSVMGVSMGALVGLPPTLSEIYGSDIKKVYRVNGVPLYLGLVSVFLSAFIHLLCMSIIIYAAAAIVFDAVLPADPPRYFALLAFFIAVSLSIGCVQGLLIHNQAKLTMVSQLVFLPSIMLSGIMFPADLLPRALEIAGKAIPASWGYKLMTQDGSYYGSLLPLAVIFAVAAVVCIFALKKLRTE